MPFFLTITPLGCIHVHLEWGSILPFWFFLEKKTYVKLFGKVYSKQLRKTEKKNIISLGIPRDCSGLPTNDAPIPQKIAVVFAHNLCISSREI